MGSIVSIKAAKEDKVIIEVEMDYEESLQLQGHTKNIHLFSEDAAYIKTNLSQRGTNEATKYFLIPRELRDNLTFDEKVTCQRVETDSRVVFIFVVDKVKI